MVFGVGWHDCPVLHSVDTEIVLSWKGCQGLKNHAI
jgi:hypothetical protein